MSESQTSRAKHFLKIENGDKLSKFTNKTMPESDQRTEIHVNDKNFAKPTKKL